MQMTKTMATTTSSTTTTHPDNTTASDIQASNKSSTTCTDNTTESNITKSTKTKQQQPGAVTQDVAIPSTIMESSTSAVNHNNASSATNATTITKKKKSKLQTFKSLSDATIKSKYSVRSSSSSISIKSTHHHHHHHHHPSPHWLTSFPSTSLASTVSPSGGKKKLPGVDGPLASDNDEFWSATSSTEERQKIREFWLQLGEDERRSLVKVEKEAVLRKMKDQQRHGCNCSVCGKKRTAIEDELEVLYDAYYEELEQYANQQHQQHNQFYSHNLHAAAASSSSMVQQHSQSSQSLSTTLTPAKKFPLFPRALLDSSQDIQLHHDHHSLANVRGDGNNGCDVSLHDEDEDYEDNVDPTTMVSTRHGDPGKSLVDVAQYAAAASHLVKNGHASTMAEHFNFGNSLTVKGGILTVADDLLKNDGRKFLDMMERLAERRIQRDEGINIEGDDINEDDDDHGDDDGEDDEEYYDEEDEEDDDDHNGNNHHGDDDDNEEDQDNDDDDGDEDEDEEDEEDDDEEEEEERYFFNDTRTEEQRIEEGRRMFQIFAARMFEQRVLSAYREKVAQERQQRLIQELEEEDRLQKERELKKQRDKEKKKDKKRLLKQQKEEERLAKEAQRKAEEEAQRLERERKEKIERQKRETERQRKEEERQRKEEERLRKEEDKRRRQREEKERRRKEKEEQQRQKQEQQRKEEAERQQQLQLEKQRKEELELERQRLEATSITTDTTTSSTPVTSSTITTDNDIPDETRHRVLMNALLGSSNTLVNSHHDGAIRDEQRRSVGNVSFAPSHLNALQSGLPPSGNMAAPLLSMSSVAPSLSNQHIGGNIGSSLFSPLDDLSGQLNKTPRPHVTSVGAIGQPVNSERRSFSSTSLTDSVGHNTEEQNLNTSPSLLKRRSTPGDIGTTLTNSQSTGMDNSFFSNFLFGESNRLSPLKDHNHFHQQQQQQHMPQQPLQPLHSDSRPTMVDTNAIDRRFNDIPYNWTNDWNASNVLTNGIRSNLFGDGMAAMDRQHMMMDRVKTAYIKLDDITYSQTTSTITPSSFYTLAQLHRMLSDMYYDQPIDIRELYDLLTTLGPQHGFQCVYSHSNQDYVVRYLPQQQQQTHYHPSSTPSSKATSSPLPVQGLSSFLNSVGSHPLSNRSIAYSSISPPHLPFPSSFTSPSLSPQPHPHQQQQQQQQQSQSQQYPFSGTTPIFGALS
ncbi:salt tolerance down-regulator-domain-containing protein [Chlamydoabsidia padenii]|nr:salt tolerance down-regulator-domain-containing protein [Chlamydoabsidia padenii]